MDKQKTKLSFYPDTAVFQAELSADIYPLKWPDSVLSKTAIFDKFGNLLDSFYAVRIRVIDSTFIAIE